MFRVVIVLALRENWFEIWIESCVSLEDAVLDVRASIEEDESVVK